LDATVSCTQGRRIETWPAVPARPPSAELPRRSRGGPIWGKSILRVAHPPRAVWACLVGPVRLFFLFSVFFYFTFTFLFFVSVSFSFLFLFLFCFENSSNSEKLQNWKLFKIQKMFKF
jgi:hypothetical protein